MSPGAGAGQLHSSARRIGAAPIWYRFLIAIISVYMSVPTLICLVNPCRICGNAIAPAARATDISHCGRPPLRDAVDLLHGHLAGACDAPRGSPLGRTELNQGTGVQLMDKRLLHLWHEGFTCERSHRVCFVGLEVDLRSRATYCPISTSVSQRASRITTPIPYGGAGQRRPQDVSGVACRVTSGDVATRYRPTTIPNSASTSIGNHRTEMRRRSP